MIALTVCQFKGCGRMVRPSAMADHWIIAQHYSRNLPAARVAPMERSEVMRAFASRGNA